ncbi:MAG TPA: hypothetical protein VIY73_10970 [Polyangiaceae bacterium]
MTFLRPATLAEIAGIRLCPTTGQYVPALEATAADAAPFGLYRLEVADIPTSAHVPSGVMRNEPVKHATLCRLLLGHREWPRPIVLRREASGSLTRLDGDHRSSAALDLHARGLLTADVRLLAFVGPEAT